MNSFFVLGSLIIISVVSVSQSQNICEKVNAQKFPGCVDSGFTSTISVLTSDYYADKHSAIINSINKTLGSCSNYTNIILCSLYVPRCEEKRTTPSLPCRSVCEEFVHECGDKMALSGLNWLKSLCSVLPVPGDCFPSDFKPSSNLTGLTCNQKVLSRGECNDTFYKNTFVTEKMQKDMEPNETKTINEALQNETDDTCKNILKKLVCAKYVPPCVADVGKSLCQATCYELDKHCSKKIFNNTEVQAYCAVPAQGETKSEFCELNTWPSAAKYWPGKDPHRSLPYSFPAGLVGVLVLVPVLAIVIIYAAVAIRRHIQRKKSGYIQQPKTYTEPEAHPVI